VLYCSFTLCVLCVLTTYTVVGCVILLYLLLSYVFYCFMFVYCLIFFIALCFLLFYVCYGLLEDYRCTLAVKLQSGSVHQLVTLMFSLYMVQNNIDNKNKCKNNESGLISPKPRRSDPCRFSFEPSCGKSDQKSGS